MNSISSRTEINAPDSAVWAAIADLRSYRRWNPLFVDGEGDVVEGARVAIRVKIPKVHCFTYYPQILEVRPAELLHWRGNVVFPGLLGLEHRIRISPLARGGPVEFRQDLIFSGLLARSAWEELESHLLIGLGAMNWSLKGRVEGRRALSRPPDLK